jgi:molybdenum cofactor biosynthesis protein MoaC
MRLSHVDEQGRARQVDVSGKRPVVRRASARARIRMSPETVRLIRENQIQKGDVLTVAKIAAVAGAKRTAELIPLAHNIRIDQVDAGFTVLDDAVEIRRVSGNILIGTGAQVVSHHMEIRGLGIINIRDLFGVAAIRYRKRIELVILLEAWRPEEEYDRLGVEEQTYPILGVPIPTLRIPVSAGRNIAILVEVAARNHLLQLMGIHAARNFAAHLSGGEARDARGAADADLPRFSRDDTE